MGLPQAVSLRGSDLRPLYHGRAMRFLHTADWHVGKTLKGRCRLAEQEQVLREIVTIARAHEVDAVLVAGDLYDTAAPTADAQKLVNRTLLGLAKDGVEVIAIAGNHDHAATIDAYRGLARAAGITLVGTVRTAGNGGLVEFTARSTGERATLAVLPFLSTRYAVRAAELLAGTPAQHTSAYDQQLRDILGKLTAGFRDDAVNLVMAHLTVLDGRMGGGERAAQSIFEYAVPAGIFPVDAHYVALGHLHRRQTVAASCPVHYSGAPLAVDFGEQENTPVVCVVDAAPGTPAAVTDVPIRPDGGCAPCAAPSRNCRCSVRWSATTSCGSGCASPPGPGCGRRSRPCSPTRWRCASILSSPHPSPPRGRRGGAGTHPRRAVRRVPRQQGRGRSAGGGAVPHVARAGHRRRVARRSGEFRAYTTMLSR